MSKNRKRNYLYRYLPLNERTLEMVVENKVYFASPRNFNDPLDTRLYLGTDLRVTKLKDNIINLQLKRKCNDFKNNLKKNFSNDDKTYKNNKKVIKSKIKDELIRDMNESTKLLNDIQLFNYLRNKLNDELYMKFNKGVLCMTYATKSYLLWSYYGDSHQGVCIRYEVNQQTVSKNKFVGPKEIEYKEKRRINLNDISKLVNGNKSISDDVFNKFYFQKGMEWEHEDEVRIIGPEGYCKNVLKLSGIIFGLRVSKNITLAKLLMEKFKNNKSVEFYDTKVYAGTYKLMERPIKLVNDKIVLVRKSKRMQNRIKRKV